MSLMSSHSIMGSKKGQSVHDHGFGRAPGELRAVGGYLTPPFSPTSTSSRSDYVAGPTGSLGMGGGGSGSEGGGKGRTRDRIADKVTKAKEKGKAKLLDHDRYRRSAVVDDQGVEHDPEYRHFRTATPVHRHRRNSQSSSSGSSTGSDETDGFDSQYSLGANGGGFTTGLLHSTAGGTAYSGAVPAYLPSAQHSIIKPHSNQVVPSLLVPPSNMSGKYYGGKRSPDSTSPRRSAEDFGAARRTSTDFGRDAVDDLGYHLEKLKVAKDKKKRKHLVGLPDPAATTGGTGTTAPAGTATAMAAGPKKPTRKLGDGGEIDLRTATLRSNAERHAVASGNPTTSRSYASKSPLPGSMGSSYATSTGFGAGGIGLSSTAAAHSRFSGQRPLLDRAASEASASALLAAAGGTADDGLPSPLANPAPPPAQPPQISISKVVSRDSSDGDRRPTSTTHGSRDGPAPADGNRFVPPPGKFARATRDIQEDYAMGVHGMRRSYESFKLDMRFGISRTKKKVERSLRQM